MPASSNVSRRTASSIVSPGSMKPASAENMPGAKCGLRPSRQRSSVERQHDRDRVGAREMLGPAGRAAALDAAGPHLRGMPATAAEGVRGMPGQQRGALRQRAELGGRKQPLHVDRAVVDRLDLGRQRLGVEPARQRPAPAARPHARAAPPLRRRRRARRPKRGRDRPGSRRRPVASGCGRPAAASAGREDRPAPASPHRHRASPTAAR